MSRITASLEFHNTEQVELADDFCDVGDGRLSSFAGTESPDVPSRDVDGFVELVR